MSGLTTYQDKVIWLIGASSGIGEALAHELASRGAILALSARRKDELEALKARLEGDQHRVFVLDVTDEDVTLRTAGAIRAAYGRIDSAVFLAGSYTPMKLDELDLTITRQIINVNLMGAYHLVKAIVPLLKDQSFGQIALCGSVSAYIGLPGGQPYSSTKAGITNLAESLHAEFSDKLDIKLISPGFVRTDLTDKNDFKMPMMIEPDEAAKEIANGLLKSGFEVHFPKGFTLGLKFLQSLPYLLSLNLTKRFKA